MSEKVLLSRIKAYLLGATLSIAMLSCQEEGFKYTQTPTGITFTTDSLTKRIEFYEDGVVRVSSAKGGNAFHDSSLTIVVPPREVDFTVKDGKQLMLESASLTVNINKETGRISFQDKDGKTYLSEHPQIAPALRDTVISDSTYYQIKQAFQISDTEGLYGLGQFQDGNLNLRGKELQLVQANKVSVVPFLISTKNYGLLWENYSHSTFHDGADGMWFTAEVADQIDYFFVKGENMDKVIAGYRLLTGKVPMFSKKSYGLWQSKERYKSFDELHQVVKSYRDQGIPLDNIVQDWRYWGDNGYWSSMQFEGENFPNPQENIAKLHDAHVQVMTSIWPSVGTETAIYRELEEKGLLFEPNHWSGGKVYNAFSEEANTVYWKHINKGLLKKGVDALWMDGTEPEFGSTSTQKSTKNGILKVGNTNLGPIAKYLNVFSLATTSAIHQRMKEEYPEKRAFILTRSAWAGQQRNAAVTWSGDVSASFPTLKKQIAAGLNFSMAGVPYWSHDIGGFFTAALGGHYPLGIEDRAYREILVRWYQFGAFSPIFRVHGSGTPREVYRFKEYGDEAFYQAAKQTVELRYQLLPYLYSLARQIYADDYTLMRGLAMDFADDPRVLDINDSYMFGPSFLVAPVTRHMYAEPKTVSNVIPAEHFLTPAGQQGLKATYYDKESFKTLLHEQIEQTIDHNWSGGGLPPGVPENGFSVRWEGKIKSNETGKHKIFVYSDDGKRLWIDGKLVIDEWKVMWGEVHTAEVVLEAGKAYDFKLEYFQRNRAALITVGWEMPSYQEPKTNLSKNIATYLPKDTGWFDYWSNQYFEGGQEVAQAYPIAIFPLFVKAGSIVPLSPVQQYVGEKPDAPVELRIYPGTDASFTLYEDEGNNYNYEQGQFATIDLAWDDAQRVLTIGEVKGGFEGYLENKELRISVAEPGKPWEQTKTKSINYNGESIQLTF